MTEQTAHEQPGQGNHLDLLMIGKCGHGKRSTGNSIIGERQFVHLECGGSGLCQVETTIFNERVIKLINTPGICDTSQESSAANMETIIRAINSSFSHASKGFNALLLVLSYTARFTEEEKEVLRSLKSIFGEDVFRNHTICVFTHGDSFRNDYGGEEEFQTWYKEQTSCGNLIKECESRVVLFDNMSRDPDEKRSKVMELISQIDSLKHRPRYSVQNFKSAKKSREQLIMALTLKKYKKEIALVRKKLNELNNYPYSKWPAKLIGMKTVLTSVRTNLPISDHNTVIEFKKEIDLLQATIDMYDREIMDPENNRLQTDETQTDLDKERNMYYYSYHKRQGRNDQSWSYCSII